MKRVITFFVLAAVVAAVGFGCCACRKNAKQAKPLIGTEWHLVKLMETDATFAEGKFDIRFIEGETPSKGNIQGVGSCNHIIGGEFTVGDKGSLTVGQLGATRMACPELDLEIKFFAALRSTTHYEIDGDVLMLLSDGKLQATLQATEQPAE